MELKINNLSKTFENRPILQHVSFTLTFGKHYCLMGPSGSGKTTFFRILLGLENADSGFIEGLKGRMVRAVFQEDRLCEDFTPIQNVAMAASGSFRKNKNRAVRELLRLLPEESLSHPVSILSGGMKRKVSIVRALFVPSDLLVMDEPFSGLDEESKLAAIRYLSEKSSGKLVIVITHQEEDVALLNAMRISLF
jgi:NitT/TauT family transport system ATP-binding protein